MFEYIGQTTIGANLKQKDEALRACGMQPAFATHLQQQATTTNTCIILRAGSPPVYNQRRGPKSGVNLSKTSNHGLLRGSLATDTQFTRVNETGKNLGLHLKDAAHLTLPPNDVDYQHRMQLPVTLQDLIREVRPEGDLNVLGYDEASGQLRLEYKPGKGPADFKGQFVINLKEGNKAPQFFSRPWDQPQMDPQWDPQKKIIRKPEALAAVPDALYETLANQTFKVYYTPTIQEAPTVQDLIPVNVMANKPRTAKEFLKAMGPNHPRYSELSHFTKLSDILAQLEPQEILSIYDKSALIVTGDWDGLALGHPPTLNPEYLHVYNTFDMSNAQEQMTDLLLKTSEYFDNIKQEALTKDENQRTEFEKVILTIEKLTDIIDDFALSRAGCITPYEFLHQQIINYTYRTPTNEFYSQKYDVAGMQELMNKILVVVNNPHAKYTSDQAKQNYIVNCMRQAEKALLNKWSKEKLPAPMIQQSIDHFRMHVSLALESGKSSYQIPHPEHDLNTHDLFQHGFDNNNPYGCNYEGAWILLTPTEILYGETQEQLCQVMLWGDFLRNNLITVNWGADMRAGWAQVISKQIELGQVIPPQTMEKYVAYKATLENSPVESQPNPVAYVQAPQNESNSGEPTTAGPINAKTKQTEYKAALRSGRENSDDQSQTTQTTPRNSSL